MHGMHGMSRMMNPPINVSYCAETTIIAYDLSDYGSKTIGQLIYGRANMSLCNINNERIAVIGGQKHDNNNNKLDPPWVNTMHMMGPPMMGPPPRRVVSMNDVELFDLE
eukprot:969579_1